MAFVLFDLRGNIQGAQCAELSPEETELVFVKPFDRSSTRHKLFEEYKRYTLDLRNLVGQSFYQWMDGSFISNVSSPNDIDLVNFISYDVYRKNELLVDNRFSKWSVSQYYTGLDAFTVLTYPVEHKQSVLFEADCAYWQDWFGHTRYNRNRKRFSKGFIRINIY